MRWESAVTRKIKWNTLLKLEPIRLQFTIRSSYDLLPTPTNLIRWEKSDYAECRLCSGFGHLEHILSSFRTMPTQRRFSWRHDKVLQKLAHHVELKRVNANKIETKRAKKKYNRIRESRTNAGKLTRKNTDHSVGLLNRATDWELRVDFDK